MANQPKKYKKFVATAATATLVASAIVPVASAAELSDIKGNTHEEHINALVDAGVINGYPDGTFKPNKTLTRSDVVKLLGKYLETQGYEPAGNYKTSPAFADLTTKTNEELLKYASIVKESGVFVGSNGNLLAGDPITRENMAIVLVRMVNTLKDISLEEFVAEQDFNGDVKDLAQAKAEARTAIAVLDYYDITNPTVANFNPKGDTTRGQFATFLNKTINAEFSGAEQGASEVVPTAIELTEKTNQSAFGEKVTITAKVTVAKGESAEGIPVTFTVDNNGVDTLLVPQLKEEVKTNADGVATYTYTRDHRYSTSRALTDDITAYPTIKPTLKANAIVYWGQSLTIKDVTTQTVLSNGAKKVYEVNGAANEYVYVAFQENLNVTPDKAVTGAKVEGIPTFTLVNGQIVSGDTGTIGGHPYEYTTGGKAVARVKLDNNGKANLVVSGTNATVTPIVYEQYGTTLAYNARALQAKASTVTFQQQQILGLSLAAQGPAVAATDKSGVLAGEIGGRDFVATLTTAAGVAVPNSKLIVAFSAPTSNNLSAGQLNVYKADGSAAYRYTSGDTVYFEVLTDKDGKAKFTVSNSANNAFATPTVFLDNSTAVQNGVLDKNDLQATANDVTYFTEITSADYKSALKVTTATDLTKEVDAFASNQTAVFTYQLSDQNGKPRSYRTSSTTVTYQVTNTGGNPIVVSTDGTAFVTTVQPGSTITLDTVIGANNSKTQIYVKSLNGTVAEAQVIATPSNPGLALGQVSKTVRFSSGAPTFTVNDVTAGTTTLDSITLTFASNVAPSEVVAFGNGTLAQTTQGSTANAVNVTFAVPVTNGQEIRIAYAGTVYVFEYDSASGKITLK